MGRVRTIFGYKQGEKLRQANSSKSGKNLSESGNLNV